MINIAIVDDDSLIRESLKIILGTIDDFNVVATGENGKDAVRLSEDDGIDLILLDMRMPEMDGIEALRKINRRKKVLVLTTFEEDYYLKESIKLGACGYILKNAQPSSIISSIKEAAKGSIVFGENTREILENIMESSKSGEIKNKEISEREKEIIVEISNGLSNKQIAEKLYISEGTVKNYISSILSKTGLMHRTQIAVSYLKGEI